MLGVVCDFVVNVVGCVSGGCVVVCWLGIVVIVIC